MIPYSKKDSWIDTEGEIKVLQRQLEQVSETAVALQGELDDMKHRLFDVWQRNGISDEAMYYVEHGGEL